MMAGNIELSLASGEATPLQLSVGLIILVLQIKSLVHYPPYNDSGLYLIFQKTSFSNANVSYIYKF